MTGEKRMYDQYLLTLCLFALCLTSLASCKQKVDLSSPTAAYKALYDGVEKQDASKVKSVITTASLNRIQETAKKQNRTFDEQLKAMFLVIEEIKRSAPMPSPPELGAESIQGDTAKIEVIAGHNKDYTLSGFVKENGEWKATFPIDLEYNKPIVAPPPVPSSSPKASPH